MPDYTPIDPFSQPTDRTTFAPAVMGTRPTLWEPIIGSAIDQMTSDPRTLNLLSALIHFTAPKIIVEVGTYRGWGTATFAETLRTFNLPGHVWSCDPTDHGVQQMLDHAQLSDRVTLITGTFEDLLPHLPGLMDFCYIDASAKEEAGLRLRYTRLALQHLNAGGMIAVDDAAGTWRGAKTLRRMANLYLPETRGLVLVKIPDVRQVTTVS